MGGRGSKSSRAPGASGITRGPAVNEGVEQKPGRFTGVERNAEPHEWNPTADQHAKAWQDVGQKNSTSASRWLDLAEQRMAARNYPAARRSLKNARDDIASVKTAHEVMQNDVKRVSTNLRASVRSSGVEFAKTGDQLAARYNKLRNEVKGK